MKVLVRPYKAADYSDVLAITMELWNLKLEPYTKKSLTVNKNIINDTLQIAKEVNEGILVATVDNEIAGVIHLNFQEKLVSQKRKLPILKLILKYGLFRLLRIRKMGRQFERNVDTFELHIHSVVVSKEYRSMGIGSMLVNEAENLAKAKKLKRITLEVLESNERALELYKRLGFKVIKKVEFNKKQKLYFNSKSHIYMMKKL